MIFLDRTNYQGSHDILNWKHKSKISEAVSSPGLEDPATKHVLKGLLLCVVTTPQLIV